MAVDVDALKSVKNNGLKEMCQTIVVCF